MKRGHFTALASRAKCSPLSCRAIVSVSRRLYSLLAGRCKLRSFRSDRARALREDEIFDLASPTEEELGRGFNWSVVTEVKEQTVIEDKPCVVDTVSDCSSGEAGFDRIVIEGGERKVTTGSIGCPKVDGVKVGKSNSRTVKTVTLH